MSLRPLVTGSRSVFTARAFASSSRLRLPDPSPSQSSSSPSSSSSSDTPPPVPSLLSELTKPLTGSGPSSRPAYQTTAAGPSAHTPERANAIRGYELDALPPNVDPIVDLFTNLLMKHGKKAEAQRRVSNILNLIQQTANVAPLPLLTQAITLSSPYLRVMSTRKRAKVVLTPMALDERQRTRQGIQWLLKAAEKGRKGGIPREYRIAKEVFAVLEGNSDVYKWIEERHKVATANRSVIKAR